MLELNRRPYRVATSKNHPLPSEGLHVYPCSQIDEGRNDPERTAKDLKIS